MAHVREIIDVRATPREAFDLIADFARAQEWDPGVVGGEALDGGVGVGRRFRLDLALAGRTVPFVYTTTAFVDGQHVTHETRRGPLLGRDAVTVEEHGSGARIVWEAEFGINGVGRLLDPLLQPGFRRVAAKAVAGLRRALDEDGAPG